MEEDEEVILAMGAAFLFPKFDAAAARWAGGVYFGRVASCSIWLGRRGGLRDGEMIDCTGGSVGGYLRFWVRGGGGVVVPPKMRSNWSTALVGAEPSLIMGDAAGGRGGACCWAGTFSKPPKLPNSSSSRASSK